MTAVRSLVRATCAAVLLVSAVPFVLGGAGNPGEHFTAAFAKSNGKSSGNSGGGSSGGGNSGGNSDKSSNASSKSNASTKATKKTAATVKKTTQTKTKVQSKKTQQTKLALADEEALALETATQERVRKEKNFHAQLAGLNSLNRNTNGLMNSSDPRMEGVRDYMGAYAERADAEAAMATATSDLDTASAALQDLISGYELTSADGSFDYGSASLDELGSHLDTLDAQLFEDPENADLLAERDALSEALDAVSSSQELADLADAQTAYDAANDALTGLEDATSDDALTQALIDAANQNRIEEFGEDYVTPDMLAWAKDTLGIQPVTPTPAAPVPPAPEPIVTEPIVQ